MKLLLQMPIDAAARRNVRLRDAIEARQAREEAVIELLALWIVLGIICTVLLLVWWAPTSAHAQTVEMSIPIAEASKRTGINTDYLIDDDATRTVDQSMSTALKTLGAHYLRFPEGEEGDDYLWSIPPFTAPNPRFARTGPNEWPSNDAKYALPDMTPRNLLDFDEFIALTRSVGGEPVVIVCYDSMYKAATAFGTIPTRQQLLDTAVAWVRYANVVRGYHVTYWELGNESYQMSSNGGTDAVQYAKDLITFGAAMKAVDPTIKLGANGSEKGTWWQTVLTNAAPSIDWLSYHNYPIWAWGSYDHYRLNNPVLDTGIHSTLSALDRYAPAHKTRIQVAVTEWAPIDFSTSGAWANTNDLGHAIVAFDMLGALLEEPRVLFSNFWVTHWPILGGWNALTMQNDLTPVGRAFSLWGQALGTTVSMPTVTEPVKIWMTTGPMGLTMFLRNKGMSYQPVTLSGLPAGTIQHKVFTGSGPSDVAPTYLVMPDIIGGAVTLPPVSVTVLTVQP